MSRFDKLNVLCTPTAEIPTFASCRHGPALFFYTNNDIKNGYFACSAYREKRDCNFKITLSDFKAKLLQGQIKTSTQKDVKEDIRQKAQSVRHKKGALYCFNCDQLLFDMEDYSSKIHAGHKVLPISSDLNDPTKLLKAADNDKVQAQYFFDEKAIKFLKNCLSDLQIDKVVCIGAPRLHASLQLDKCFNIKSFLLDFDKRFYYFYDDCQFAWYNMCNNHFFDECQRKKFLKFLKKENVEERILFITDPPFGCRTEAVTQTLRALSQLFNTINKLPHQPVPIFWIFPYYMGQYIKKDMPEMEMSDYKINYTNHLAYSDSGDKENRKQGSPVRLFTNVAINLLKLPVEEGYKYCTICQFYTALENRHCKKCGKCPSKNGDTYRHCNLCGLCVKPSYVHCKNCRRCTQIDGHDCTLYQSKQQCWICQQIGHIERHCKAWQKACKKFVLTAKEIANETQIHCLLCDRLGHNELQCPQRGIFVEQTVFMGEKTTRLK